MLQPTKDYREIKDDYVMVHRSLLDALTRKEISTLDLCVYVALAFHMNRGSGECFPSHNRLAAFVGVKRRQTVIGALLGLLAAGFVKWTNPIGSSCRYSLHFHPGTHDRVRDGAHPPVRDGAQAPLEACGLCEHGIRYFRRPPQPGKSTIVELACTCRAGTRHEKTHSTYSDDLVRELGLQPLTGG